MSTHLAHPDRDENGNTDPRTDVELFNLALLNENEEIEWEAISELQRRGTREIFDRARQHCSSENTHERRIGADILGQLGLLARPFHDEIVAILLNMLKQEQYPGVLHAVAVALGHRNDARAIVPLTRLKHHANEVVRFGMVFGLMGYEDTLAIQTLIESCADTSVDVRDWATFGLGTQIESDTPAIRECLLARLQDTDEEVRGEAIAGLARRGDKRVLEPLIASLEQGLISSLPLEAAAEIGDSHLLPILQHVQETWDTTNDEWLYKKLLEAIERCQPAT